MASLYKRGNGYFYLSFYAKDRKPSRKQVATGTTIKRDAEKVQRRLEREYLHGEFDPWNPEPESGAPDLDRLGDAVALFLASRSNLSPYTQERYRSVLERLSSHLGRGYGVRSIDAAALHGFLDSTDTKPVTQHSYRRAMRTFFLWLKDRGAVNADPTQGLRLERAPDKHPRFLTPANVEAICKAIRAQPDQPKVTDGTCQWLLPIVRANVYLGLRAGELVNLRWADVDLDARTFTVRNTEAFTTKAGKERTLPLCDTVVSVLGKMERRSEYVFPNYGGTQLHRLYLSRRFKHFARLAKLPEYVNFHTTRHTCASWLAQRGAAVEAIRLYMGHSSISVTQRYMHLNPQNLASQINAAFNGG